MKILITAPSLEENENVSGISSVVRQIIGSGRAEFFHFAAGRRDGEKVRTGWLIRQFFLVPRLWREIKKQKIELVHINTALTPLSIWRDAVLTETAKLAGARILLHIHGGRFLVEGFDNRLLVYLTGRMIGAAGTVLVLSEGEKKLLAAHWQKADIRVLENAVPLENVRPRKAETAEKTMIFLGRLHEGKGLREIIEVSRILRNAGVEFKFNCYGTGDLKDFFIKEMTAILGKKFFYGGVIAGADKWEALAAADIFLLPTHYEGLPLSLLEAMAAGCVPVVSDVGSIGTVVENSVNGFLTEPRNPAQVAEKLRLLLTNQADWKELRKNATRTIREKFDLKSYIEKLEDIYRVVNS